MDILDGDDVRLSSRGRYAERDIVQVLFTGNCVYCQFSIDKQPPYKHNVVITFQKFNIHLNFRS